MAMTSWYYLPALLVLAACYWRAPAKGRSFILCAASLVFYASWDWRFLPVLLLATVAGYFGGLMLERGAGRGILLWLGVGVNLLLLFVFKYYNFLAESLGSALAVLDIHTAPAHLSIITPIGISFFTLQAIGYLVDVHRGRVAPCRSLCDFALFMCFFPKLLAGPLEDAGTFLAQLYASRRFSVRQFWEGIDLILLGLLKKLVVVGRLVPMIESIFSFPRPTPVMLALGAAAFSIQAFADISSYTDIARGSAKLFGLELSRNFKYPFLARNVAEFWNRWHITLTAWVKSYVFMPTAMLLRNLGPRMAYASSIAVAWIVMGLWHGASAQRVVWGLYWGVVLIGHQVVLRPLLSRVWRDSALTSVAGVLATIPFVLVGNLIYRVDHLGDLGLALQRIDLTVIAREKFYYLNFLATLLFYCLPLVCEACIAAWCRKKNLDLQKLYGIRVIYYTIVIVLIALFRGSKSEWVYFQL